MGMKPKYDWTLGRKLYDAGLSDAEIARQLGCETTCAVSLWRRRERLPLKADRAKYGSRKEKILRFQGSGLSSSEIARRVGCNAGLVRATFARATNEGAQKHRDYCAKYYVEHKQLVGLA